MSTNPPASNTTQISVFDLIGKSTGGQRREHEASSFKLSNRPYTFVKKKSRKSEPKYLDVEAHFNAKMHSFNRLRESVPGLKERMAQAVVPAEKEALLRDIRRIEEGAEETEFILKGILPYQRYVDFRQGLSTVPTRGTSVSALVDKYDDKTLQSLAKDYFDAVGETFPTFPESLGVDTGSACKGCGAEPSHSDLAERDGYCVCTECGLCGDGYVPEMKASYKDLQEYTLKVSFHYKKLGRLNEWLNAIQTKDSSKLPRHVIPRILEEIEKDNILDMSTLTPKHIRTYLKRLDLNKWYDHVPFILNRISGVTPLTLTAEQENTFRRLFQVIEEPFERLKAIYYPSRSNFLSYPYCLHRISQLLGWDEVLPHLPLLKSTEKLRAQDAIWKLICDDLGWEFIPSV